MHIFIKMTMFWLLLCVPYLDFGALFPYIWGGMSVTCDKI